MQFVSNLILSFLLDVVIFGGMSIMVFFCWDIFLASQFVNVSLGPWQFFGIALLSSTLNLGPKNIHIRSSQDEILADGLARAVKVMFLTTLWGTVWLFLT